MAETTYYAWAPIVHRNEDGSAANVAVGKRVPSDLLDSVDEETRDAWIHDGVIRREKYPDDVPAGMSVRTHLLRRANDEYERAAAIGSPGAGERSDTATASSEQPASADNATAENAQQVGDTNKPAEAVAPPATTQ